MKDSKEKEHRISNLKDMLNNVNKKEEDNINAQESFDEEDLYIYDDSSDDYEVVDAKDMINTLSRDYDNFSNEELSIDDEYIYRPSNDSTNPKAIPLEEENKIDKDFIIEPELEDNDFSQADIEYEYETNDNYNDYSFEEDEDRDYIAKNYDRFINKKIRGIPIISIISLVIGIILMIFAFITLNSAAQRVIDSVASGETNTLVAACLLIGLLFIIFSIYKILSNKGPYQGVINSIKSVDKENNSRDNEEVIIEQKPLANDHKKVKKIGEFNIDEIKQKIEKPITEEIKPTYEERKIINVGKEEEKESEETEDKQEKPKLTEKEIEEIEYKKAQLDNETIDDIFADIEEVPIISIDSKEKD